MKELTAFRVLALALAWPGKPAADEIVLQQADRRELRLAQPANRLFTLTPHLAEQVFARGAGVTVLATVEYSNYP